MPMRASLVDLPLESTYMSRLALVAAVSRKSSARASPATRATAKPPPPTLPAVGYATARAKAVATAAFNGVSPCNEHVPTHLRRDRVIRNDHTLFPLDDYRSLIRPVRRQAQSGGRRLGSRWRGRQHNGCARRCQRDRSRYLRSGRVSAPQGQNDAGKQSSESGEHVGTSVAQSAVISQLSILKFLDGRATTDR